MNAGARKKVRVLVADDHPLVREWLRQALEQQEYHVVAGVGTGAAAVSLFEQHKPDIVIMDVGMPDMSGVEATRRIIAQKSDAKVLALSAHSKQSLIQEMLRAGAIGYLTKDCLPGELLDAVRAVAEGGAYLGKSISGTAQNNGSSDSLLEPPLLVPLSDEDRETMQLAADGLSAKEIADRLHIGKRAVDKRLERLKAKLDVNSTIGLVRYGIRAGIVRVE